MAQTRIFLDRALSSGDGLELPDAAFRHLIQVLRMQCGDALTVFNGEGGEYEAKLSSVTKRAAAIEIGAYHDVDRESIIFTTLVQGICKGDRMDWALQKAVELGVSRIIPVVTARCNVQLSKERAQKRWLHWRGVVISACEQSGRTVIPELGPVTQLSQWFQNEVPGVRLILDPRSDQSLRGAAAGQTSISAVIGPEGGLSADEVDHGIESGCLGVSLGPRILRTETAGVAVLSILQSLHGDLA